MIWATNGYVNGIITPRSLPLAWQRWKSDSQDPTHGVMHHQSVLEGIK